MNEDPLNQRGGASPALREFLDHFRISTTGKSRDQLLRLVISAFARLPYENLSKIVKLSREGNPERARRGPGEVVGDHVRTGSGGTCFALTASLIHLLRALGWRAEPILADRHYGPNTHCALVVWLDDRPCLVDPGYLILDPVPLDGVAGKRIENGFNSVLLTPVEGGEKFELFTEAGGSRNHRLTLKTRPADIGEFLAAWDASFGWDMMSYPVLTRVDRGRHVYLQRDRLQRRAARSLDREEVPRDQLVTRIQAEFGIDRGLAARALEVLRRRGEM